MGAHHPASPPPRRRAPPLRPFVCCSYPLRMPFVHPNVPHRYPRSTSPPSSSAPHAPIPSHIPIYNKVLGPFRLAPVGVVSSAITAKKGHLPRSAFCTPVTPLLSSHFLQNVIPLCHPACHPTTEKRPENDRKRLRTTASSPLPRASLFTLFSPSLSPHVRA